jgi:hypothetical protein
MLPGCDDLQAAVVGPYLFGQGFAELLPCFVLLFLQEEDARQ